MKYEYVFQNTLDDSYGLKFQSNAETDELALKEKGYNDIDYIVIKIIDLINHKVIFDAFRGIGF